MNISTKMTLYDLLTMMVTGVIISHLFGLFGTLSNSICFYDEVLYCSLCFIIGMTYYRLIECLYKAVGLINPVRLIIKGYRVCRDEFGEIFSVPVPLSYPKQWKQLYFKEYYSIMDKNCLNSISALEAQEAFLRALWPIMVIMTIANLFTFSNGVLSINHDFYKENLSVVIGLLVVIIPIVWYFTQFKICKLVWEGAYHYKNQ